MIILDTNVISEFMQLSPNENVALWANEMPEQSLFTTWINNAANYYGQLCAIRESQGKHVDPIDLMIVAIAKRFEFKIATRNTKDFSGCGITIIDPWATSQ